MKRGAEKGPAPGWGSLSGEHRAAAIEVLNRKIERDPTMGGIVIARVVGGPVFAGFRAWPCGDLPIGLLCSEVQSHLGAKTALVRLPERIMHKQDGRRPPSLGHPQLTAVHYRHLPRLIAHPEVVLRSTPPPDRPQDAYDRRLALMGVVGGKRYFAVLERDRTGRRVELISFSRRNMTPTQIRSLLDRAAKVYRPSGR